MFENNTQNLHPLVFEKLSMVMETINPYVPLKSWFHVVNGQSFDSHRLSVDIRSVHLKFG